MKCRAIHVIYSLILLGLSIQSAKAQLPDVLSAMPEKSQVIIATKSLDKVAEKIMNFGTKIGTPLPITDTSDISNMLLMSLGITGELDGSSSIGIAIQDLKNPEETAMLFLPLKDPEEALKLSEAQKNEAAPGVWSLPSGSDYAIVTKKYTVICSSPTKLANLKDIPKGAKLSQTDLKLFEKSDIAASMNITPFIEEAKSALEKSIQMNPMFQSDPNYKFIMDFYISLLEEMDSGALGLRLSDLGVNLNINLNAKKGSDLAKGLSGHPMINTTELKSLPSQAYWMAMAFATNSDSLKPLFDTIFEKVKSNQELTKDMTEKELKQLKESIFSMLQSNWSAALYLMPNNPSAPGTFPGFKFLGTYKLNDAKTTYENMKNMFNSPFYKNMYSDMIYTPNAGKVGNVSFDTWKLDMTKQMESNPAYEQLKTQMGNIFKMTMNYAIPDNKTMVIAGASGEEVNKDVIKEVIEFPKSGKTSLADDFSLQTTAKGLPKNANGYLFFHIGNYVRFIASAAPPQVMMMAGMFTQIQGTVGTSITMDNGSLQMDTHIPIDTIQQVTMMVTQMMQMMQGPPPGAGAPPTPGM